MVAPVALAVETAEGSRPELEHAPITIEPLFPAAAEAHSVPQAQLPHERAEELPHGSAPAAVAIEHPAGPPDMGALAVAPLIAEAAPASVPEQSLAAAPVADEIVQTLVVTVEEVAPPELVSTPETVVTAQSILEQDIVARRQALETALAAAANEVAMAAEIESAGATIPELQAPLVELALPLAVVEAEHVDPASRVRGRSHHTAATGEEAGDAVQAAAGRPDERTSALAELIDENALVAVEIAPPPETTGVLDDRGLLPAVAMVETPVTQEAAEVPVQAPEALPAPPPEPVIAIAAVAPEHETTTAESAGGNALAAIEDWARQVQKVLAAEREAAAAAEASSPAAPQPQPEAVVTAPEFNAAPAGAAETGAPEAAETPHPYFPRAPIVLPAEETKPPGEVDLLVGAWETAITRPVEEAIAPQPKPEAPPPGAALLGGPADFLLEPLPDAEGPPAGHASADDEIGDLEAELFAPQADAVTQAPPPEAQKPAAVAPPPEPVLAAALPPPSAAFRPAGAAGSAGSAARADRAGAADGQADAAAGAERSAGRAQGDVGRGTDRAVHVSAPLVPRTRCAPSPIGGEGWGEGATRSRRCEAPLTRLAFARHPLPPGEREHAERPLHMSERWGRDQATSL